MFSKNSLPKVRGKMFIVLFFFIFLSNSPLFSQPFNDPQIKHKLIDGKDFYYIDGEILVRFWYWVAPDQRDNLLSEIEATILRQFYQENFYKIKVPSHVDLFLIIENLNLSNLVEYAEPNGISFLAVTEPNDPYFYPKQWNLKNIGQTPPGGTNDADIDAPEAWDIETGNSNVIISIIDSGIDYWHEDITDNMWTDANGFFGKDFTTDPPNNYPKDDICHGTHIAGIASAVTNNNKGISGVSWSSKLMAVKITGATQPITNDRIYDGIHYAVDNGGDILNCSFYCYVYSSTQDSAMSYAYQNNCIVSVCAGNTKGWPRFVQYPAALSSKYNNLLAVAATDHNDLFAVEYSSCGREINVAAPGGYGGGFPYGADDIFSTTPDTATSYMLSKAIDESYDYMAGTSMAAPHVSGLAALILSVDNILTPVEVRSIIELSADDVNSGTYPGKDIYIGSGRINAYQALLVTNGTNLSQSSTATAYNNGRRLLRDANNRYHLIFASGGEIFYRRSNIGGTSWEAPLRLSIDNNNKCPSISGTSSKQFVVWQHHDTGNSKYYINFSKNTGSGWSDADTIDGLSDFSASNDPLPVISYKNNDRVVVCIRGSSKLCYAYSDNNGRTWTASDLSFTSSSHANPSLSMGPTTPASTVYLTYDNGSNIYLNTYTSAWGSVESVSTGSAYLNNQNASLEFDNAAGKNVDWEAKKNPIKNT